MPIEPTTIWGALAVAGGLFSKEFFAYLAKRSKDRKRASLPPAPPPQYTPEDSWRDYCKEKFETLTSHAKNISDTVHHLDKRQEVLASQISRIELDHQTICTGKGQKHGRN